MTDPSQYFRGRTVQEQMNEVIGYVDVRAAEVATDAIAADVAQVHSDAADAHADALAAAASAAAAAGTLANAVKKTGESSQTVEGDITMSTGDLGVAGDVGVQGQLSVLGGCDLRAPVTVAAPVNNTDAATKKYVDDALDNYAPMVRTTGLQTKSGAISFVATQYNNPIRVTAENIDINNPANAVGPAIAFNDMNGNLLAKLFIRFGSDSTVQLRCEYRKSDGTTATVALVTGT